jgi:hypothetical protein
VWTTDSSGGYGAAAAVFSVLEPFAAV